MDQGLTQSRAQDRDLAPAAAGDLDAIVALLDALGLPSAGAADQFPRAFVVAKRDGALVGCAGLEVYGRMGLLRSVAVRADAQRGGLGRALVADRVAAARRLGLDAVVLLTTTAADYFPTLGFIPMDRASVPEPLASAPELASVCPASARCFVLRF